MDAADYREQLATDLPVAGRELRVVGAEDDVHTGVLRARAAEAHSVFAACEHLRWHACDCAADERQSERPVLLGGAAAAAAAAAVAAVAA